MDPVPALLTPSTTAIVRAAEALTGHPTEAPFLTELGIDTVVLGPGNIAQAHQPDEFLAVDRLDPSVKLLQALIRRFCINDGGS